MKHLALLIPGLDRLGGAEGQVLLLARGLRKRGWKIGIVVLSGSAAAVSGLAEDEIDLYSLGMHHGLADPRGWLRFRGWLKSARPDIVHAHLPHAAWLARWSRPFASIPVLLDTLHTSSIGSGGRRMGYRLSRSLPDCVTAVSHAAASAHSRAGMVASGRLTVLPNAVDVAEWQPDSRARAEVRGQLGLGDTFLFLAAGRLEPVKDYATLLQAMAQLPKFAAGSARLLIAGDGSQRIQLTRLATRLGVAERVDFLGFQPDLRAWMQAADAFVLSSRWEGLPVALLQAAACSLPVIATNVPGTPEAMVDGATGWLVSAGNPDALASALARMFHLAAPERQALGLNGRRFVAGNFHLETILDRWEALYDQCLTRTRSQGSEDLS